MERSKKNTYLDEFYVHDILTSVYNTANNFIESLEIQTQMDEYQKNYVEGFISALFHSSTIDLTRASTYRHRLQQIKLL